MDPQSLIPIISPVMAAIIAYLRDEAAKKVVDKTAETVGEKVGESLAGGGSKALTTLRSWFENKKDAKAQTALTNLENDPDDKDFQDKLVKETARLATDDLAFAQELQILAQQATIVQPSGTQVNIDNAAPNYGAQGVFHAPMNIGMPPRQGKHVKKAGE